MKALLDADILAYEFGACTDDEGNPIRWPLVFSRLDARIQNIVEAAGADSYQLYLSGKNNFRNSVATIKPYKGNRKQEKPFWHEQIRQALIRFRNASVFDGIEADDALGIAQVNSTEDTIICSRDKDLLMIPGWHYVWPAGGQQEREPFYVEEIEAIRNFYCQLVTGDSVDNILGLHGVGPRSSILTQIRNQETEIEMLKIVQREYQKRLGSYWELFLMENAKLLWMLRQIPTNINEVEERLRNLLMQLVIEEDLDLA